MGNQTVLDNLSKEEELSTLDLSSVSYAFALDEIEISDEFLNSFENDLNDFERQVL